MDLIFIARKLVLSQYDRKTIEKATSKISSHHLRPAERKISSLKEQSWPFQPFYWLANKRQWIFAYLPIYFK